MTAQIPDGSVIVTPTEMYAEIRAANQKIDHLATLLDPAVQDIRHDVADHETRIRSLEHRVWRAAGMATVAASVIALAVEYVASH